jgi:hypothetical protein
MSQTNPKLLGHMVYFTLKERTPQAIEGMIAACKKYLTGHPGTIFFGVGTLTPDLVRPVNDREFDIALQVVFDSRASQDAYQVHPRHIQFIEENKPNWAKVRVFDADITC